MFYSQELTVHLPSCAAVLASGFRSKHCVKNDIVNCSSENFATVDLVLFEKES